MKDNRTARVLYLVDHLERHAPHPFGRFTLLQWINDQLDELPSDLWDPALGDASMEIIIQRYPTYLEAHHRMQARRRQMEKETGGHFTYSDVSANIRYYWNRSVDLDDARVFLIRHGESTANAGLATGDPATIPLTPAGEEQARLSAGKIDSPTLIVSSPFARALATAQPLRDRYPNAAFGEWAIQEFTYLDPERCAGTTVSDRKEWVREYWGRAEPHHQDGPGAETFAQFLLRVVKFLYRLRNLPVDCRIAAFGHGQFFNAARWIMETGGMPEKASDVLERTQTPMSDFLMFDLLNPIENGQVLGLLI